MGPGTWRRTAPPRGRARAAMVGALLALTAACGLAEPRDERRTGPWVDLAPPASDSWVLSGADVLPMTSDTLLRDHTLVVRDGRIVELGPRDQVVPPADLEVIEAGDRVVLPGLGDMHVHLRSSADLDALLDAGVTFVRNMWGTATTRSLIQLVADGERPGPYITSTGPGIDGSPPIHPGTDVLVDPSEASILVADQLAAGWPMLKVYQGLSTAAYQALVEAAGDAGVPLVGHVPTQVSLGAALPVFHSMEHLEGYAKTLTPDGRRQPAFRGWTGVDPAGMEAWAQATAEAGTWICPTLLVASRMLHRNLPSAEADRATDMRAAMVRHLDDAGVPLLAGTDAGVPIVDPGASLHDELDLLVGAGLAPARVLRMATADAARFLGIDGELGTVRPGARADLLVVAADPRHDLATLRTPRAVIVRGHWVRIPR